MKIILLLTFILSNTSWALDFTNLPPTKDGNQVIKISGGINRNQKYPDLKLKDGDRIFLSSPGGTPDQLRDLTDWFSEQVKDVKPIIIVKDFCASTCTVFLSVLNDLSRIGHIDLVLDKKLTIGFHGCYNPNSEHMAGCNAYMIRLMKSLGVKEEWLEANSRFFTRPYMSFLVRLKPDDPVFVNSGYIDYARIEENTESFLDPAPEVTEEAPQTE